MRLGIILVSMVMLNYMVCTFGICADDLSLCADTQNGYRLHYPSDWTVEQFADEAEPLKALLTKDDHTGIAVKVYTGGGGDLHGFLERYVPEFVRTLQRDGGTVTIMSQKYISLAGQQGFIINFDYTKSATVRFFYKIYIVVHGDIVYIFQCRTLFDNRLQAEPQFNSIVESLELVS